MLLDNEQAEFNIANGKSDFHSLWQADFPTANNEVRIERDEKTHIADIFIENVDALHLDYQNFIGEKGKDLVIEVQYSPISLKDAMDREKFYRTNECELLWVFDISRFSHEVDRVKTISKEQTRILFFGAQHPGVPNVVKAWEMLGHKPNMILDDGSSTLFFVSEMPKLDEECMSVVCIDRVDFMRQIGMYVKIEDGWKHNMKNDVVIETIDYSKVISTPLADNLLNCFVFTPIDTLRDAVKECTNNRRKFSSFIEGIANWLGQNSMKDPKVFSALKMWTDYCRTRFYKEKMKFGAHSGVSFGDLPFNYVKWMVEKKVLVMKDKVLHSRAKELYSMCDDTLKFFFYSDVNFIENFEEELNLVNLQKVAKSNTSSITLTNADTWMHFFRHLGWECRKANDLDLPIGVKNENVLVVRTSTDRDNDLLVFVNSEITKIRNAMVCSDLKKEVLRLAESILTSFAVVGAEPFWGDNIDSKSASKSFRNDSWSGEYNPIIFNPIMGMIHFDSFDYSSDSSDSEMESSSYLNVHEMSTAAWEIVCPCDYYPKFVWVAGFSNVGYNWFCNKVGPKECKPLGYYSHDIDSKIESVLRSLWNRCRFM
jgi:hypothetical protein